MNPASAHTTPEDAEGLRLSCLFDGQADASDVLPQDAAFPAVQVAWSRYTLIHEALQAPVDGVRPPDPVFVAEVMRRVACEARPDPSVSVGAQRIRGVVANDSRFHWRPWAVAASVLTVAVVSWQGLRQQAPEAATQLVQDSKPAQLVAEGSMDAAPATVFATTAAGPVLRDPRLDALMDAHRHYGGMTAWQAPTGFLRNATYEAVAAR